MASSKLLRKKGPTSEQVAEAAKPMTRLEGRREELRAKFTEMQWDLGGAVYEMAARDYFRLDVLAGMAARLQIVDAELAEIERMARLERAGADGTCAGCGSLYARGAVYCWRCGRNLFEAPGRAALVASPVASAADSGHQSQPAEPAALQVENPTQVPVEPGPGSAETAMVSATETQVESAGPAPAPPPEAVSGQGSPPEIPGGSASVQGAVPDEPALAEEPIVPEDPPAEEPVLIEEPVFVEEPVLAEPTAIVEEPVLAQPHVSAEAPVLTEQAAPAGELEPEPVQPGPVEARPVEAPGASFASAETGPVPAEALPADPPQTSAGQTEPDQSPVPQRPFGRPWAGASAPEPAATPGPVTVPPFAGAVEVPTFERPGQSSEGSGPAHDGA